MGYVVGLWSMCVERPQSLHIWWFKLIMNVLYNKFVLDLEIDDVREDDEDAIEFSTSNVRLAFAGRTCTR